MRLARLQAGSWQNAISSKTSIRLFQHRGFQPLPLPRNVKEVKSENSFPTNRPSLFKAAAAKSPPGDGCNKSEHACSLASGSTLLSAQRFLKNMSTNSSSSNSDQSTLSAPHSWRVVRKREQRLSWLRKRFIVEKYSVFVERPVRGVKFLLQNCSEVP